MLLKKWAQETSKQCRYSCCPWYFPENALLLKTLYTVDTRSGGIHLDHTEDELPQYWRSHTDCQGRKAINSTLLQYQQTMTPRGKTLKGAIEALISWGNQNLAGLKDCSTGGNSYLALNLVTSDWLGHETQENLLCRVSRTVNCILRTFPYTHTYV